MLLKNISDFSKASHSDLLDVIPCQGGITCICLFTPFHPWLSAFPPFNCSGLLKRLYKGSFYRSQAEPRITETLQKYSTHSVQKDQGFIRPSKVKDIICNDERIHFKLHITLHS